MENGTNLDLTEDLRSLIEPLVSKPEEIRIKRLDKPEDLGKKEQNYLILCAKDDLGKLKKDMDIGVFSVGQIG